MKRVRGRARGLAVLAALGALAAACSSGSGDAVGGGLGDAARAASDASAEAALQDGSLGDPDADDPDADARDAGEQDEAPADDASADAMETVDGVGELTDGDCPFESEVEPEPSCMWLTVPMVRDSTGAPLDDRTIEMAVAVYPAWGSGVPEADPIVYLEGGPGVSALSEADLTADWLWRLNEDRDLIVFDQRGLGASTPALRCPEVDAAWVKLPDDATEELSIIREREAAEICRARLADEGVEVSAYNTVEAAADLADLRVAMQLEEWNVLGVSYGTRLGQTLVREHPEGIRAVILDGAYPLDDDPLFSVPRTGADALHRLFDACEADPVCADRHPDLERRFVAAVESLNAEPWDIDFGDTEPWVFPVTGDDLADAAHSALYDAYSFVDLPRLIDVIEAGESWALSLYVGGPIGGLGDAETIGTFLAVNCRDEVAFSDPNPPALDGASLAGNDEEYVADMLAACEAWDVGRAPAAEDINVTSDLPTLISVGTFDPITPVEHARQVAATFRNSTYVEFGDRGHGTLGDACADQIALEFLADPGADLDLSCVDRLDGPPFAPVDPGPLDLVPIEVRDTEVALESRAPTAWGGDSDTFYFRDRSLLDYTALGFETFPDSDVATQLGDLRASYGEPLDVSTRDVGGVEWTMFDLEFLSDHNHVALADFDGTVVVVTLTTGVHERERVAGAIWREILAATQPA